MRWGEFVLHDGYLIWVEYEWLDSRFKTAEEKAKQIFESGWIPKVKGIQGAEQAE